MAFEHLNCRPSKTDATDAIIQGLERFFGEMIDKQESLRMKNAFLDKELTSARTAFDEAQSRYESLYQTHREADVITAAIRRIVACTPSSALTIWLDEWGFHASRGVSGIADGETLVDALTNLDARLATRCASCEADHPANRPGRIDQCKWHKAGERGLGRDTPPQTSDEAVERVSLRRVLAAARSVRARYYHAQWTEEVDALDAAIQSYDMGPWHLKGRGV